MDVLQRIKNHYEDNKKTVVVEVPEWGEDDKPLVIHASPMSLKQRSQINERMKRKGEFDAYCYALVLLAKDENGKKIFKPGDEITLMTQGTAQVVMRVANELLEKVTDGDPESDEDYADVKKN